MGRGKIPLTEIVPFVWTLAILGQCCVCVCVWATWGLTVGMATVLKAAISWILFSFQSALRAQKLTWKAEITDDTDILVYWYGKEYSNSHTCKYTAFIFNCLAYSLKIMSSSFIHIAENDKISI